MNYHIKSGNKSYLFAETKITKDTLDLYIEDEGVVDFFETNEYKKIKHIGGSISVICNIYVEKDQRKKGIAKKLLEKYLNEIKVTYHVLVTDKSSDTKDWSIENFYEKYGFKVVVPSKDFSVMVKESY